MIPTISDIYNELRVSGVADFYVERNIIFVDCFNDNSGANHTLTIKVSTKATTFQGKLLTSFEKTPFYFCNYSSVDELMRDLTRFIKNFSKTLIVTRKRKDESNLVGVY